jgi:hypothetical protein
MHFVISGTWGPTDPARAMLPFIFAASAVQDVDTVTRNGSHRRNVRMMLCMTRGSVFATQRDRDEPARDHHQRHRRDVDAEHVDLGEPHTGTPASK